MITESIVIVLLAGWVLVHLYQPVVASKREVELIDKLHLISYAMSFFFIQLFRDQDIIYHDYVPEAFTLITGTFFAVGIFFDKHRERVPHHVVTVILTIIAYNVEVLLEEVPFIILLIEGPHAFKIGRKFMEKGTASFQVLSMLNVVSQWFARPLYALRVWERLDDIIDMGVAESFTYLIFGVLLVATVAMPLIGETKKLLRDLGYSKKQQTE